MTDHPQDPAPDKTDARRTPDSDEIGPTDPEPAEGADDAPARNPGSPKG